MFGNIYLTDKRNGGPRHSTSRTRRPWSSSRRRPGAAIENARLYEEATTATSAGSRPSARSATTILVAAPSRRRAPARRRTCAGAGRAPTSPSSPVARGHRSRSASPTRRGEGGRGMIGTTFPIEGSISGEVVRSGKRPDRPTRLGRPRRTSRSSRPATSDRTMVVPLATPRPARSEPSSVANRLGAAGRSPEAIELAPDLRRPGRRRARIRPRAAGGRSGSSSSRTASGSRRSSTTA